MSEAEVSSTGERRRPLWLAWLAGWLTSVTLGWLLLLVYLERDNARLDEGHVFEEGNFVRPPALFTLDWIEDAALMHPKLLLIGLGYAIPMILLIALLERADERSAIAWSLAGAVAAVPLGMVWLALATLLPPRPIPWTEHLIPPLILVLLGVAGGGAARLVRNGRS
jgi:hypothetical protein